MVDLTTRELGLSDFATLLFSLAEYDHSSDPADE